MPVWMPRRQRKTRPIRAWSWLAWRSETGHGMSCHVLQASNINPGSFALSSIEAIVTKCLHLLKQTSSCARQCLQALGVGNVSEGLPTPMVRPRCTACLSCNRGTCTCWHVLILRLKPLCTCKFNQFWTCDFCCCCLAMLPYWPILGHPILVPAPWGLPGASVTPGPILRLHVSRPSSRSAGAGDQCSTVRLHELWGLP